jgi:hypothetical protein
MGTSNVIKLRVNILMWSGLQSRFMGLKSHLQDA